MKKPILTIQDWDTGIADDPYKGFQLVKNLNENMEGIASCGFYLENRSFSQSNLTFTAGTDDVITTASDWKGSNPYGDGMAVTFTTTGTLPAGLTAGVTYFTTFVSNTKFKVSTTLANVGTTFVDITDAGTGTHTVSFTQIGAVTQLARNPQTGYWYLVDSNGRVWSDEWTSGIYTLIPGNDISTNVGVGNGLVIWKNYVLVFKNQKIDAYGPLSAAYGSRTWDNNFFTLGVSSSAHQAIASLNDKVYWCDGNNVGYLMEDSDKVFDPGDNTTFTPDAFSSALDLPDNYTATYIEDYGNYLAVAASKNNKSYIFPWDRVSSSFNFPIEIPEGTIHSLKSINNILYIITNNRSAVYQSNLSSVSDFRKIPLHLSSTSRPPSGIISITSSANIGGKLYLGIRAGTSTAGNTGVYSLNLRTGALKLTNTISNGITTSAYAIGAIGQYGQFNDGSPHYFICPYLVNGNIGGLDTSQTSQYPYLSYESQIVSPIYQVSTDTFESTAISRAIFYLQIPIGAGDGIKLEYREYDTQAWTQLGEVLGVTYKSDQIPVVDMEFHAYVTQVQFRISIKSSTDSTATFVRLKKVDIF